MWFKNLVLYRFTRNHELTAEQLEQAMQEHSFRPCGKTELSTYGWVPPVPGGEPLVHVSGGFITLCARKQEKILPASVVKDAVNDKVSLIEAEQGRQVFRKEKEQIKDEVTLDLLPRAFTKSSTTRAYIDLNNNWLIVDASSFRKAEELTTALRSSLGSLPVVPPALKQAPAAAMTHWLEQEARPLPGSMVLGDECELKDMGEDGGVIRCKGQDLLADEITSHLSTGMQVSRLALHWNEALSCILGDDLLIRRLKFTDTLQEQSEAMNADDEASRFDADFTLMTGTLAEFLDQLMDVLGGEEAPEASSWEADSQAADADQAGNRKTTAVISSEQEEEAPF